jgi:hypothetical protein
MKSEYQAHLHPQELEELKEKSAITLHVKMLQTSPETGEYSIH